MSHLVRLFPALLLFLMASAATTPVRQADSSAEPAPLPAPYQVVGLADFFAAVQSDKLDGEGVDQTVKYKTRYALISAGTDLFYRKGLLVVETKGISGAVESLKAAGVDIPDEVVAAAAKVELRPKGAPEALVDAARAAKDDAKGEEGSAIPVRFVSSLKTGQIAALLEAAAILFALLIAANLRAIASLTARWRLYSRGTASLRDSTWNVGIVEGFSKPGILLRDFRALIAFLFALFVVSLEVLTVVQTQPGDSCAFDDASTWKIEKSPQQCFTNATDLDPDNTMAFNGIRSFRRIAYSYVAKAKTMVESADLEQGIPVNTNVFEDSIISGKAVKQLKDGNYEERYTAPVIEVIDRIDKSGFIPAAGYRRLPNRSHLPLMAMWESVLNSVDADCSSDARSNSGRLPNSEPPVFFHTGLDYPDFHFSLSDDVSSWTGFVHISACHNVIHALNCGYVKGPIRLEDVSSHFPMHAELQLGVSDDQYAVQCKLYNISSEDRKPSVFSITAAIDGTNRIGTDSIRRAILAALIAQNSANNAPCQRYLAVPRRCTRIGWLSVGAIATLLFLFVASSIGRMVLRLAPRDVADYNGSSERWVVTLFEYFSASGYAGGLDPSPKPRKPRRRDRILGPRFCENDIHISVSKDPQAPLAHNLVLTRAPIADPATYIPSNAIAPNSSVTAGADSDATEVSLV